MKRLLIALTLMMVLPAAAWSMSSTTNKDFEDGFQTSGIANGWQAATAITTGFASESSPANVHNGAWSQKVVTAGSGVKAKFDTEPGLCTVSVWVKAPAGAAKVAITAGVEDYTQIPPSELLTNTANNTWQKLTKTLVAKRSVLSAPDPGWIDPTDPLVTYSDSIVVFCATAGGTSYFDEVTVEPVGEHVQPQALWWNVAGGGDRGGNPFLCGGVFDGNVIFGQISNCVKMYGHTLIGWLDPPLYKTPDAIGNDDFTAKCATVLNGYIYCTTGYGDIRQSVDWGDLGRYMPFNKTSTVPATDPTNVLLRKKVNNDSSALVTDGTYLYAQDDNLGGNAATNTIYKWQMNHANGGSIVGNVSPFPKTITGYSQFLGICYYDGKIYAAEGMNGGQILEIDTTSGVVTPLLSAANLLPNTGGNYGQVARYGDKIFVGTASGHLYTWQLIAGTWTLVSGYDLHMDEFPSITRYVLGLAANSARSLWVTTGGCLRYYDLPPGSAGSLKDVNFDTGLSEWVNDAVITAKAPAGEGFWVENIDRTTAAFVAYTGDMTTLDIGNLVTIKAMASRNASGERVLTPTLGADAVVEGAAAELKPLMMTNKTMGPVTGSIGLANDGMLVKIAGKVTGVSGAQGFFLDDGSGVPSDSSPILGVKVVLANGGFMDSEGVNNWQMIFESPQPCTAVVTGVVRLEKIGDTVYRRIDARSAADIVITAL